MINKNEIYLFLFIFLLQYQILLGGCWRLLRDCLFPSSNSVGEFSDLSLYQMFSCAISCGLQLIAVNPVILQIIT